MSFTKEQAHAYYIANRERLLKESREYYLAHRAQRIAYQAAYQKLHPPLPHKMREYNLRHEYGMEMSEYEALLRKQNNRCAICQEKPRGTKKARTLHVDHDHESGETRGLLC